MTTDLSTIRFRRLIAPEETLTGDDRQFARGALTWRKLPLPVMYTRTRGRGHDGAVTVGELDTITYEPGRGWVGEGNFFDPGLIPEVSEAIYLARKQVSSPSVDLQPGPKYEIVPHPYKTDSYVTRITQGKIMGFTFVPYPAFEQTEIMVESARDENILASAGVYFAINNSSWRNLPLADRNTEFDFDSAIPRIVEWSQGDVSKLRQAFLYQFPNSSPARVTSYLLLVSDVVNGELALIPRAVFSAATFLSGGHGGLPQLSDQEQENLRGVVTDIYDALRQRYGDLRLRPPWQRGGRQDARGAFDIEEEMVETTFAVNSSGWSDMPLASTDRSWDEGAARSALATWADIEQEDAPRSAWNTYRRGFLWYDDTEPELKGSYKFPIAMPIDGTLTIVPRAVSAALSYLDRGDIPDEDKSRMRSILERIQGRYQDNEESTMDTETFQENQEQECPEGKVWDEEMQKCVASEDEGSEPYTVTASNVPVQPPREWFNDPQLTGPTPLTVTEDGRVFGHLATWDMCHMGIGNACVTAPRSKTDYSYFKTGSVVCADGSMLHVGKITCDTGHADPQFGVVPAIQHYDNTGSVAAVVTVHEDTFGPVVAGAMVPDASPEMMAKLRRSPLSGDWRQVGGNLELVAALAVVTPGFPVVRASATGDGLDTLLAAAIVTDQTSLSSSSATLNDIDNFLRNEAARALWED